MSVTNNSLSEDYSHPDDHTRQTSVFLTILLCHMKMADFIFVFNFSYLSIFAFCPFSHDKIGINSLNMASSDSQMDTPQCRCPKRAELPDVNINTGAQSINTERVKSRT